MKCEIQNPKFEWHESIGYHSSFEFRVSNFAPYYFAAPSVTAR